MDTDYRELLKRELEQRCRRNTSYSLRAFAKSLDLAAPHLSGILSGKKGLSKGAAERIAGALNWSATESSVFVNLVEAQHSRSKRGKRDAEHRLQSLAVQGAFQTVELEQFKLVSDWQHFAILQLFELDSFKSDAKWIAERLNIAETDSAQALDRLEKSGLIQRGKKKWSLTQKFVATPNVPSSAIRNNLHQMMKKASDALESQAIDERDFSALLMPIDRARLGEAKTWIQEFRRNFCSQMDRSVQKNSVYCLSVQFFRVSDK
jgi:uncharacterized protein (TIGR02147 family)